MSYRHTGSKGGNSCNDDVAGHGGKGGNGGNGCDLDVASIEDGSY